MKNISTLLLPAIVVIGGGFYVWGKVKEGKRDGKKSTLDLLGEEVEKLRQLVESKDKENKESSERNKNTIHTLEKNIVSLQTQIDEKDKKLREYIEIFQGRDPQLLKVLNDIHLFMERIEKKINTK